MKKVICVVGSEGGIGAALCKRLQASHQVIGMDVRGPIPIDLANPASIEQAFASARAIAPHIDALALTAGILDLDKLANLSLAQWNHVLAVNLTGPFLCCQAAQHWLRDGGRMVLTGSLAGRTGGVLTGTAYAVSKGGIESLTKSMAQELAPRRITVNCVAPGGVDTPMVRRNPPASVLSLEAATPLKRLGTPDEIAAAMAFLLSDDAAYITGEVLAVNGGIRMD
ncbi:MAG: SDR family oxidoreductase [Betaproteobacteria bacterium]|nr:SDR family oxidoreductase [Betaproteobacteria bacterium]